MSSESKCGRTALAAPINATASFPRRFRIGCPADRGAGVLDMALDIGKIAGI
jgi:hypothetical protein